MKPNLRIATALLGLAVSLGAFAQGFPAKPVRMVVPYPAGGPTDQLGRIIAEHMTQTLGQTVVVENRGGANTQIGTAEVAKAAPDGHTILFGGITPFVFNPLMYSKLQYDPKDLTGVIHAYPTLAQINRRVADQRLKEGLTPTAKKWIQRIFGLREARP